MRTAYGRIASEDAVTANGVPVDEASASFGYSPEEIESVPDSANLGLGCGNPLALDAVAAGEVVLDLGSGAGFDCLLAARKVGSGGRVIGVDITAEMVERAQRNAAEVGVDHVEFRQGSLEDLPVEDASVDRVISNCVIGLVSDRARVFREAFRVLRPGGRIAVSDTIVTSVPEALRDAATDDLAWVGASGTPDDYLGLLRQAGFVDVAVVESAPYPPELAFEEALVDELVARGVPRAAIREAAAAMLSVSVIGAKPQSATG